jgi:hypothetical protein
MAQDAPEVAWAELAVLVVGVVAGDSSVVVVVEAALDADCEEEAAVEVVAEEAPVEVVAEDPVEDVPVAAVVPEALAWWGWAASAANRPRPATEPAASQPVVVRLRRSQRSRMAGVVMQPS